MEPMLILVVVAGLVIGAVNGANDVSKGIATLVGSGVARYQAAIRWGTFWTAAGCLAAAGLASAMVATFGKGLLAPGTTPTLAAALATIFGAAVWVLIATRNGLPVSTTHAIVGALCGSGVAAYGWHAMRWAAVGGKIILPLVASPLVSFIVTRTILRITRRASGHAVRPADCLCAEIQVPLPAVAASGGSMLTEGVAMPLVQVTVAPSAVCESTSPESFRISVDRLHWLTSGATSFARGLNDAPKMAALLLGVSALVAGSAPANLPYVVVTFGVVAGSLAFGRRVTGVLAEKVTRMSHEDGFVANIVTSVLVITGAVLGLPMSTTHVSTTAIIATGSEGSGNLNREMVWRMVLAWLVTVPMAATLAALAHSGLWWIS